MLKSSSLCLYSSNLGTLRLKIEQSLDDPLPKLCPVIPTSNQDGRQAKNRKRVDEIKKKSSPLKLEISEEKIFF
jgi:hypothetical protein